jgi:hypothetical protein
VRKVPIERLRSWQRTGPLREMICAGIELFLSGTNALPIPQRSCPFHDDSRPKNKSDVG